MLYFIYITSQVRYQCWLRQKDWKEKEFYVKEYSFTEGHQKINLYLDEILSIAGNYYLIIPTKGTTSKAVQFIYSK